jgi:hypothetical protein
MGYIVRLYFKKEKKISWGVAVLTSRTTCLQVEIMVGEGETESLMPPSTLFHPYSDTQRNRWKGPVTSKPLCSFIQQIITGHTGQTVSLTQMADRGKKERCGPFTQKSCSLAKAEARGSRVSGQPRKS